MNSMLIENVASFQIYDLIYPRAKAKFVIQNK